MAQTESMAAVDELLSEEAGAWCLALLYRRLERLLPLVHEWLSGASRFLGESETARAEMQEFHRGHDNLEVAAGTAEIRALLGVARQPGASSSASMSCKSYRIPRGSLARHEQVERLVAAAILVNRRDPSERCWVQLHDERENVVE